MAGQHRYRSERTVPDALPRFVGTLPLNDSQDFPPRVHPSTIWHAEGSVAAGVGAPDPAPAATTRRRTTRYLVRWP
ncbi:MAG: hypothetical protein ACRDQ5_26415 [Sciscionella sp.]